MRINAKEYILNAWDKTIRVKTEDEGKKIGLPYPFSCPSSVEGFFDMYYWDTYFTNIGLILSGRTEQAKNNCMNIAYLINRYGFMPNGNCTYFLSRSQPPFFSLMVRDVYEQTGDKYWLDEMYAAAKREYNFWQNERGTKTGLNRYFGTEPYSSNAKDYCDRVGIEMPTDEKQIEDLAYNYRAVCESGWDCSSRCGYEMQNYNVVDLNALLYDMEQNLAYFCKELNNGEENAWLTKAEARKEKINLLLYDNEKGAYYDYNFVNDKKDDLFTLASYYPLYASLCSEEQAKTLVEKLSIMECDYGLACCEPNKATLNLQWDYPNGWACLQYITIKGLLNYGYKDDALRIAKKYVDIIEKIYNETGYLWEKYNVVTGTIAESESHRAYEMMGWSAGIYLYCLELLKDKNFELKNLK